MGNLPQGDIAVNIVPFMTDPQNEIRVSSTSVPGKVAGCICHNTRENGFAEIAAIGPDVTNLAIKSLVAARRLLLYDGHDLVFYPFFRNKVTSRGERTAIMFYAENRRPTSYYLSLISEIEEPLVLHVSSQTNVHQLAKAIQKSMNKNIYLEMAAIGVGAVHIAVRAIAVARGLLLSSDIEILCRGAMCQEEIKGRTLTVTYITL